MRALMLTLNSLLFTTGLMFHISTYLSLDVSEFKPLLNLTIIIVFLLSFGLVGTLIVKYKAKGIEISPLEALYALPKVLKYSIIVFIFVALGIFFFSSSLLSGGGTQVIEGKYFLTDKTMIIREISESDYMKFQFVELRMITCLFLLFNYIEMIAYYYLLEPKDKTNIGEEN